MTSKAMDFYFFDFDKNIMKVKVPFVLVNTEDGSEMELSAGDYMDIKDKLGKVGKWKSWSGKDIFRNYSDLPNVPLQEQPFVKQIEAAIDSGNVHLWQAPSWGIFVSACNRQRPLSLITARGHSDETIKAGFQVLKDRGWIEETPNYLTIYNVTNPVTRKALGDPDDKQDVSVLKRRSILKSVDTAVEQYGRDARHYFGMSDDTMTNVEFIADAMRECKETYLNMRFFVIATNVSHLLKAEIFPINVPVTGHGDPNGMEPLHSYLDG